MFGGSGLGLWLVLVLPVFFFERGSAKKGMHAQLLLGGAAKA